MTVRRQNTYIITWHQYRNNRKQKTPPERYRGLRGYYDTKHHEMIMSLAAIFNDIFRSAS
jgi:hypothetical protein